MKKYQLLVPTTYLLRGHFYYQFLGRGIFSFSVEEWNLNLKQSQNSTLLPEHIYNNRDWEIVNTLNEILESFPKPHMQDFQFGQDLFSPKVLSHLKKMGLVVPGFIALWKEYYDQNKGLIYFNWPRSLIIKDIELSGRVYISLYVVNMGGTHFDFSYRDFPFPVIADYTPAICC